jgi:hypothetical protein
MPQTSEANIIYIQRPDATPETEISVLANVYKFVLSKCDASQKRVELAPEPGTRNDAKE